MKTFYEVQGYYPVRGQGISTDPKKWQREWLLWMKCRSLTEARKTHANGKKLIDEEALNCFTSFSKLRIVRVQEQRKIVPIRR